MKRVDAVGLHAVTPGQHALVVSCKAVIPLLWIADGVHEESGWVDTKHLAEPVRCRQVLDAVRMPG